MYKEENIFDNMTTSCINCQELLKKMVELERRVCNLEAASSSQILIVQKTLIEVGKVIVTIKQIGEKI